MNFYLPNGPWCVRTVAGLEHRPLGLGADHDDGGGVGGQGGLELLLQVLVTFTGPGRVWVTARLDIDDGLTGAQVKELVRGIESGMKRESEAVYRVDVVPSGVRLGRAADSAEIST
jgi:hypothetical protein